MNKHERLTIIVCLGALLCAICIAPLLDPSESRYASIGQRMVLSGNWLVPEINRGDGFFPFWGKPPLHFWMIASSFSLFGFSNLSARLPSFISLIATLFLTYAFVSRTLSLKAAKLIPFIFLSCPVFLLYGSSCLIDPSLVLWETAALVAYAFHATATTNNRYGLLFWLALAFGFLTKGPLMLALVGFVIAMWSLYQRDFKAILALPWIRGVAIFLLMTLPWFIAAEAKTPGLINYFFVNENFKRFVSPDYVDLYGSSHRTFRGVIVLYWLAMLLPWGPLVLIKTLKAAGRTDLLNPSNKWLSFALLWAIAPVVIFLPSNNVLITYVLPSAPGIIILASFYFSKFSEENFTLSRKSTASVLSLCIAIPVIFLSINSWLKDEFSTITLFNKLPANRLHESLTFYKKAPYSALYNLQTEPSTRNNIPVNVENILDVTSGTLIIKRKSFNKLTNEQRQQFNEITSTKTWLALERVS